MKKEKIKLIVSFTMWILSYIISLMLSDVYTGLAISITVLSASYFVEGLIKREYNKYINFTNTRINFLEQELKVYRHNADFKKA